MKVGPASVILEAAQLIGISDKSNFFHCMSSCLIKAPQDRELFKQAFFLFWQNPKFQERMRDLLIPQFKNQCEKVEQPYLNRLQDALGNSDIPNLQPETETMKLMQVVTVSDIEFFQHKDFRMMTSKWIKP